MVIIFKLVCVVFARLALTLGVVNDCGFDVA